MREVKFRGRMKNNEWVYGSYQADVMCQGIHTILYCDYDGYYMEEQVDPKTVGQYTGLKDVKGNEIYEGDILYDADNEKEFVGIVEWDSTARFITSGFPHVTSVDCYVKGNIYDNPNLQKAIKMGMKQNDELLKKLAKE